jgi:hypothetical protein
MAKTLPIRLRTIAAAVTVIATGLIIFTSYQSIIGSSDEIPQALPIIHAPDDPFRVLPDDPGGMDILNKDSTFFDVLDAERDDPLSLDGVVMKEEEEPETILEQTQTDDDITGFVIPEEPEKRVESLYGVIEDLKERDAYQEETPEEVAGDTVDNMVDEPLVIMDETDRDDLKEKLSEAIQKTEENVIEDTESIETEDSNVLEEDNLAVKQDVMPMPKAKPSVSISPQTETVSQEREPFSLDRVLKTPAEKHYIQLASLRSEADARAAYGRIRDQFPSLVSGLDVVFPKVDLGARGVFTRIQIGPLSHAEAKKRCADYTSSPRGGTCLVVSR